MLATLTPPDPRWFPVLSSDGRLCWSTSEWHPRGWRWMPEWLGNLIMTPWNRVACRFLGHLWLDEWPEDDGRVACSYCCLRRKP